MAKKGTGGGGRLSRTETVSVRLDPKLNYLCELAARAQRRTKSSFIEWAIEHSLQSVPVLGTADFDHPDFTIGELADKLWDTDEPDRLVHLAFNAPSLMNHEEQVIWKLIRENGSLWRGKYSNNDSGTWVWRAEPDKLVIERLREHWEAFVAVANGTASADILPSWQKEKSPFDLDDEIPF